MKTSIFIGLVQNTALLVASGLIYDFFRRSEFIRNDYLKQVLIGLSTGAIALLLMGTPWVLTEGIVFDTRSVLISISGLFFGTIPTIIGMAVMIVYRVYSGGDGVVMGSAVVLVSGITGLLWRHLRYKKTEKKLTLTEVYVFGLVVHAGMLACTVFLPDSSRSTVLEMIYLPVITIYPLGTTLLGWLMLVGEERRNMVELVAEREKNFRGLFNTVNEAITIQNFKWEYIEVNPGTERMFGYTRQELLGKRPVMLHAPECDCNYETEERLQQLNAGEMPEFEFIGMRKDGEVFNALVKLYKGKYNGEDVVIGLAVDITELKKAEQKILQAKEKAEEANRLKSNFLANMSHELRTPMIGILGYAELMRERSHDDEVRKTGDIIHRSASRLMKTLSLILDVSSMEAGRDGLRLTPADVNLIISHLVEQYREVALQKGIELHYSAASTPGICMVEVRLFEQVVSDLIDNAVKFTFRGKVEVSLNSEIREGGAEWIRLSVKDTGIGIAPEHMNQIWEEFRQASEGWDRNFEGSGLGLSISRKFVRKMGGTISVTSSLGEGSEFVVELPCGNEILEKKTELS